MRAARLTLFAPNLSGGGAERVLARLGTHWAEQGRDVTLVTVAAASSDDFPLAANVTRIGLGLTSDSRGLVAALRSNLRRVRTIRETFRAAKPDVVLSFIEQANVLALIAARPLRVPVVVSERTDPARHPVSQRWQFFRRRTYPRCAALVVLTDEIAAQMRPVVRGRPVVVVPNGVSPPSAPPVPKEQHGEKTVLGVGRLSREKGFDELITAFAYAAVDHPEWRLVLLGEGPDRTRLEKLAAAHAAVVKVELPGRVPDPGSWYARADLFALPSRYEGFPNALLEAMAHGLPVIAYNGPSAVRDVVRDGLDGVLVAQGNTASLFEGLRALLSDPNRRRRMGEAARDVVTRFSLDAFFAGWDAVVDAAAKADFSQVSERPGE